MHTNIKSRIANQLKWKYLEQRIKPYVYALLSLSILTISLEIWKIGQVASNLVYFVN